MFGYPPAGAQERQQRHDFRTIQVRAGQIYIPRINWMMLVMVLLIVGMFRTSSALAAAYGIAVTGTMVITSMMAFVVVWRCWHWSPWAAAALISPILLIDTTFLVANLAKVIEGGWLPLVVAAFLVMVMLAWREGTSVLSKKTQRTEVPLADLLSGLERRPHDQRVPGTAVFLTAHPQTAPTALLHNMKRLIHHCRNGKTIYLCISRDSATTQRATLACQPTAW